MRIYRAKLPGIFRALCYLIILAVVVYWVWDNYAAGYVNWFMIGLGVALLVMLVVRNDTADRTLGIILGILSFYMLLAVTYDFGNHLNGTHPVRRPWVYFGFGYAIFGATLMASVVLCFMRYLRRRRGMRQET